MNYTFLKYFGVFANYAEAFRPEVSVRTGRDRLPITDERDPFEGTGWDVGLKFSTVDQSLFAMLTIFETRKENLWVRQQGQAIDADGNLQWEDVDNTIPEIISYDAQTGEQLASGVELEVNGSFWDDRMQLRAGWTFLNEAKISAEDREFLVGQRLRASPEHKFVGSLKYKIRSGPLSHMELGFNLTSLVDDRIYWIDPSANALNAGQLGDDSPFIGEPNRFWGEGYTTVDFFAAKKFDLTDKIDLWLRLNLYNIFNEDYQRYRSRGDEFSTRFRAELSW
jgi:outer membrane receptor protein involved in Fe transport